MRRSAMRSGLQFGLVAAVLAGGTASARADDFSGSWNMNANGWRFVLKIEQRGDTVVGTMTGVNNDQTSTLTGRVDGNKITFTRMGPGQEYEGYLLTDDPTGKDSNRVVAGVARAGDVPFGWVAVRRPK